MRFFFALALVALACGCKGEPPPLPLSPAVAPDTTEAPTADEIDAGAGILRDALKGASGG